MGVRPTGTEPTLLDVTNFVMQAGATLGELKKAQKAMRREFRDLRTQNAALAAALKAQAEMSMAHTVALAKAFVGQRGQILDVPAAGITPTLLLPLVSTADAELIGGSAAAEQRALYKAVQAGTITGPLAAIFRRHRRFTEDPDVNADLRKKVAEHAVAAA